MPTQTRARSHSTRPGPDSARHVRHAAPGHGTHIGSHHGETAGRHVPTFVFADLVGYTALTHDQGDETGALVAREFHRAMRALTRDHFGWTAAGR